MKKLDGITTHQHDSLQLKNVFILFNPFNFSVIPNISNMKMKKLEKEVIFSDVHMFHIIRKLYLPLNSVFLFQ
jgi:hypothetical protein